MVEPINPIPKQSLYLINYNDNSNTNSGINIVFIKVDIPFNKLSIQLLAYDVITYTKIKHVIKIEDNINEAPKLKTTQEKRIPIQ